MPDVVHLRTAARRTYERGRARAALRVALVVVPLAVLCARETEAPWKCAAVGAALLFVSVLVRWRQPHGTWSVDAGLATGAIPMAAALVLCRFASSWPADAALSVCVAAGFVSGGLASRAMTPSTRGLSTGWLTASLVAGLTAAMGCVGIGVGTAAGAVAGVALGAIVAVELPRGASV